MSGDIEAVRADAETAASGASVPLVTDTADVTVTVPPPGRWRTRANRALREGDFDGWAELVLSPEDYTAWLNADPTNDDVEKFFLAWGEATGEDRGKSRRSAASSRSTTRR